LPPDAFSGIKIYEKCARTPLEELTALLKPPNWIKGVASRQGREGREGEVRGRVMEGKWTEREVKRNEREN